MSLASRLSKIEEPQTIKMAKLSRELRAQGKDIIDLSLGEPDFKTPQFIIDAAIQAMNDGYTKYPPVAGFPELKQAIVDKFKRENNLDYTLEQVMACTGAKQCLYNAALAILNEGDEVVIPTPYWVTYGDIVKLAESTPILVKGSFENEFKISVQQLEDAITDKTKLFIFSSPCNPTGTLYTKDELQALAAVFEKHPNIYIISDEIYEHINFTGKHESIAQFESIKDRVIVINGLSKAFAMTGWRLGYVAGPADVIKACEKIQSQVTSGPNSITQRAAITALNVPTDSVAMMRDEFEKRRNYIVHALREIPNVLVNMPPAAFYVFPDMKYYIGKGDIKTAEDLCMYLLHEAQVSCVTGSAFNDNDCIRISYATNMEKLIEAVKRIKEALIKLQ
jgi:aspartate aminotransferase